MTRKNIDRKTYVDYMSEWFEKMGIWCYDHRLIVIIIYSFVIAGSLYLASGLRIDNSSESFFAKDDPVYANFLRYIDDFGSDEISYILYDAPGFKEGPWNIDVMRKIDKLSKALEEETPFVKRVISLSNAEFIEGEEDKLIVYDLLGKFPEKQEELLKIRDKVFKKPMYVDGLISRDLKYAALIIEMEKSSIDPLNEIKFDPAKGDGFENLYPFITYDKIEEILKRPEFAGINFHHSGDVPINAVYNKTTQDEGLKLTGLSLLLLCVILTYFFKNFIEVIAPVLTVSFALIITLGFIRLMGWDLDLMATILPTFIIVVGVAASIHIVSDFRIYQAKDPDSREAVKHTIYLLGVPCLFTSLTDVAGFISMGISPIKAIKHFAIYSAFGSLIAFVLTVTFLPVFLSLVRKKPALSENEKIQREGRLLNNVLEKITLFDLRHKNSVLAAAGLTAALSIYGMFQLTVDTNWLNEFSKTIEVRRATELVDSVMGGSGGYSYTFDTKKQDGILDPDILKTMDLVSEAAKKESRIVMKTYSIVDLIKDINMSFHGGDRKYYTIPDSRDLIAQYVLLYETSGGDELKNYISSDYSRANIEIRCKSVETSKFKEIFAKIDSYIKSLPDIKVVPQATGVGVLWVALVDYIVESQVNGFWLAFIGISLMMCFLFKSVKLGILGMIPNVLPIMMTLGLMGFLKIPLDYVKILIGCISIGIAVDDTIHMLTRCHHEFSICGNYKEAVLISIKDVGRAVYITTLILISGFLILTVSIMDSLAVFGLLIAFTLGAALIIEFFLTPALLFAFKPYGPEFKPAE